VRTSCPESSRDGERLGVEATTYQLQVQCTNHYTIPCSVVPVCCCVFSLTADLARHRLCMSAGQWAVTSLEAK